MGAHVSSAGGTRYVSPADYRNLLTGTKFSPTEINDWFVKFRADYPTGVIRKADFLALYKKLFPGGDPKPFCDYIFKTYDLDNNGSVDFKEFLTTLNMTSRGTPTEKLRWTFRMYDINGDKFVSEAEFTKILSAIYRARRQPDPAGTARAKAKELMEDLDVDKDKRISEDEFVTHAMKCPSIRELLQGGV